MMNLVIPTALQEKLIENMVAIAILTFIKEHETDKIGISKDMVAKFMNERDICSRPTTLKIIDSLMQAGLLLDQGRKRKNSSDLVVSKDFNFKKLMQSSVGQYLNKLEESIKPLKYLIDEDILTDKVTKTKGKTQILLDVD